MKFLGLAKKFLRDLGTEPPAKVQYFNVACASGHRVRGERTEGYQALRCPACGEGVFVLPRSPLPEPAAPARASGARAAAMRPDHRLVEEGPVELTDPKYAGVELADRGAGRVEADIIWEDEPAEPAKEQGTAAVVRRGDSPEAGGEPVARAAEPATPRKSRPKTGARTAGSEPGRTATPATEPAGAGSSRRRSARVQEVSEPKTPALLEVRVEPRRRSHHGLIFVLVPLLVIAAGSWRYWKQRRQEFPLIAERARDQGIPALDAGDFSKAHHLLAAGKQAVDALGGGVEGAEEIRHAADEAAIYVDLCDISLEDMLVEVRLRRSPRYLEIEIRPGLQGPGLCLRRDHHGRAPGREHRELRDRLPGLSARRDEPVRSGRPARPDTFAHIDLTGFELFKLTRPSPGDSVKFGAKLAGFQFDSDKNYWVVQLEPKSGVFLTHPRALEALGEPAADSIDLPQMEGQP